MRECLTNAIAKGADLRYADLRYADLRGAYLRGADLRGADLRGADLRDADLRYADLRSTYLDGAYLDGAYLRGADLRSTYLDGACLDGAYLRSADLRDAYLRYADLSGADLDGAYLDGADLRGAKNIPFIPLSCPSDGEFIAWKKVCNKLIRLLIPSDARRSSATSRKCRCDKAKVLEITDLDGSNPIESITNFNYAKTSYVVGEMVFPDLFDENRWNECSHGIYFFIDKQEAINY